MSEATERAKSAAVGLWSQGMLKRGAFSLDDVAADIDRSFADLQAQLAAARADAERLRAELDDLQMSCRTVADIIASDRHCRGEVWEGAYKLLVAQPAKGA